MKQGRTLAELGVELERQRNARKDYLVNTSALSMKTQDGKSIVQFENGHEMETYRVGDIAHQQLATYQGRQQEVESRSRCRRRRTGWLRRLQ